MSYPVFYVPAGDVLPVLFDTYAGSTGASVTMTGLAVTDIEIYKDGSTTQRSSDNGYTLLDTDGIDFDGLTGIHGFSIDTGDNTDSGFYTVGAWFTVVVSTITVDSQTVSFIACQFRVMPAESVAGKPKVDTDTFGGTAGTFASGVPEVKVASIANNAIAAAAIASDAITAAKIADGAIDAATFASGALDAVWSVGTRLLTAGTNIALAKGTGVTGFNDLDAAGVRTAVGLASANLDTQLAKADLSSAIVEGTTTWRQAARGWNAALLGKASGLATTAATYRDIGDTKDRIVATVDVDGNRSGVTLDLT